MITFFNTTGILDQSEIQRLTTMWRFDIQTGKGTKTFTADDGKIEIHTFAFDKDEPISINSFINANLNPGVGRCVSLNGPENYVLMANGGWDRPLHDGDTVSMVPAVGIADWVIYAYIAVMAIMMAYAIYMIATMKTGDGSGQSNVYSLSHLQNEERPGKSIERQYGTLKRFPSYAAKPWSTYKNNIQTARFILCLGHGRQLIHESGFEDTDISQYEDVNTYIIPVDGSPSYFSNNVSTSSEVESLELFATNQSSIEEVGWPSSNNGKWFGWYTANKVGTTTNNILLDFEFPAGIYDNYADGDKIQRTVTWEVQYRTHSKAPDGSVVYGDPVTLSYSKKTWKQSPIRLTIELSLPDGAYQVRSRRTCRLWDSEGRSKTTLNWKALRAVLPNTSTFGNVTTVMITAKAQTGLSDSASKRFYTISTAYTPVYNPETKTWTDAPNRNPIWAMCDIMHASYGGNYPYSYLDLDQLYEWAVWCDDNEVYFDHCFADEMDVWSALARVANVLRASPIVPLNKLRIIRDEPIEIPTAIFTKENIIDGSFQIQYKGVTDDDYDGYSVEYTDERTWDTETVNCVLPGYDGSNLKTVQAYGITDRTRAYRWGMWALSNELESRAAISFDTNINGWLCTPGQCAYINHPLFRMATDGRILSASGTTIVLDRNVKLSETYANTLKIRSQMDGGVLQTVTVSYADAANGDYHTLTASESITTTGMDFSDPQSLPIFALGVATNFAKKVRITKMQNKPTGTSFEVFIDTEKRFAYDTSYPDVDIPSVLPTVYPSAPTNVTISAYDPDGDSIPTDIQISWTGITEIEAPIYIVQYSTDGETWTTVVTGTSETTALIGTAESGSYYARVAAIYSGVVWAWGESAVTFIPQNLTQYIQSSSDLFIDVSSDGYIMSHYGA